MEYKSQHDEAQLVALYFEGFIGKLLSIGENDGITFSNSYDLIHAGWGGALVEPTPVSFGKLLNLYKYNHSIGLYNFAIGLKTEKGVFYSASDPLLATMDVRLLEKWESVTHEIIEIDFLSFNDALEKFDSKKFDFITIDCEGADWDILQQIDLISLECKCICVEHNSIPGRAEQMRNYCSQFGLSKEILLNGENIILAK